MPSAASSDGQATLLKTIESMCDINQGPDVGVGKIKDHDVLFAHHLYPAFLPRNKTSPKLDSIVLVQPYSESAKRRSLSAIIERKQSASAALAASLSTSLRRGSSNSDLNVTGSPLKNPFSGGDERLEFGASPFIITVAEKEHKTGPVVTSFRTNAFTFSQAQSVWSGLNALLRKSSKHNLLPIYIIVDGCNAKGTILYGIDRCSSNRSHVYNKGPLTQQQLPLLNNLHALCTGPATAAYVESNAVATYEVVTDAVEHEQQQNNKHQQQLLQRQQQDIKQDDNNQLDAILHESGSNIITLECSWPRPTAMLSRPAPDALTNMSIMIPAGDGRGLLSRELRLLSRLVDGLMSQEVMWYVPVKGQPSTVDKLNKLFEQHSIARGEKRKTRAENRGSYMFEEVISGFLNTQHIDFIDSLWVILCECSSLYDLRIGMQHVFHAIAVNHIRPQVHVRNNTKVGVICRGLMRGQVEEPDLSGLQPLTMLVELGIAKITRDYTTILQAGELATGEQIAPFISKVSAATATKTTISPSCEELMLRHGNSVSMLQKLQLTIHVAACLHHHLHLQPNILSNYTVQILQQLSQDTSEVIRRSHTFNFPLQTSSIKELLNSVSPSSWQINLTSSDNNSNNTNSGGNNNTKAVKTVNRTNSSSSNRATVKYSSDLQVTVTHVPIVKIVQLDDEFGDLSLLDQPKPDQSRQQFYCNFVSTVTDSFM